MTKPRYAGGGPQCAVSHPAPAARHRGEEVTKGAGMGQGYDVILWGDGLITHCPNRLSGAMAQFTEPVPITYVRKINGAPKQRERGGASLAYPRRSRDAPAPDRQLKTQTVRTRRSPSRHSAIAEHRLPRAVDLTDGGPGLGSARRCRGDGICTAVTGLPRSIHCKAAPQRRVGGKKLGHGGRDATSLCAAATISAPGEHRTSRRTRRNVAHDLFRAVTASRGTCQKRSLLRPFPGTADLISVDRCSTAHSGGGVSLIFTPPCDRLASDSHSDGLLPAGGAPPVKRGVAQVWSSQVIPP
ncbi:hypothetical protein SKAU_G00169560 [Synaphobranchus kaupii]|uniref:Uncharacterized protein n=1 Tax=Synaphobranchus kaupii TaxID=118154 RepID=A0A9Q1FK98_SYNKA|nr:hypothetical protein SKAU_G00169560 [Synaphobranchus kaupii]